jgi:hypothetical protein
MTKPTLGAIVDDKPVKLTFDLPAHVHGDLAATRKFSLGKVVIQSAIPPRRSSRR